MRERLVTLTPSKQYYCHNTQKWDLSCFLIREADEHGLQLLLTQLSSGAKF